MERGNHSEIIAYLEEAVQNLLVIMIRLGHNIFIAYVLSWG